MQLLLGLGLILMTSSALATREVSCQLYQSATQPIPNSYIRVKTELLTGGARGSVTNVSYRNIPPLNGRRTRIGENFVGPSPSDAHGPLGFTVTLGDDAGGSLEIAGRLTRSKAEGMQYWGSAYHTSAAGRVSRYRLRCLPVETATARRSRDNSERGPRGSVDSGRDCGRRCASGGAQQE